MSEWKDGFASGYEAGLKNATSITLSTHPVGKRLVPAKKPRKAMPKDGYHAKYGRAFKRLAKKFKKKDGSWKKDGFKRRAAAARKEAKK